MLTGELIIVSFLIFQSALEEGTSFSATKILKRASVTPIYIRVDESVLPKEAKYGDRFHGLLTFQKNSEIEFAYINPTNKKETESSDDSKDDKETESEKFEAAVLKTQIDFLSKLIEKKKLEEFIKLSEPILKQNPENLQLLQLKLKAVEAADEGKSIRSASCLQFLFS